MSKGKNKKASVDVPGEQQAQAGAESDTKNLETEADSVGEKIEISSEDVDVESEVSPPDIDTLNERIVELQDQLLRKQAEFENFRKRLIRDREDGIRFANSNLILDLVEIIDNFERAIKSSEESQDFSSFHEGIELIEKQFTSMLESKWGLKRFESEGEPFDPERHQAIAVEETTEDDVQMVIEDYQKGYLLHDRVLRHAKVKVSVPPQEQKQQEENAEAEKENE